MSIFGNASNILKKVEGLFVLRFNMSSISPGNNEGVKPWPVEVLVVVTDPVSDVWSSTFGCIPPILENKWGTG